MRMQHLMIIVAGVVGTLVCVGCARESRWTLSGNQPRPIASEAATVKSTRATPAISTTPPTLAIRDVELVQRQGRCFLLNKSAKRAILVTLTARSAAISPAAAKAAASTLKVLSLPASEMAIAPASHVPANVSYRIMATQYR